MTPYSYAQACSQRLRQPKRHRLLFQTSQDLLSAVTRQLRVCSEWEETEGGCNSEHHLCAGVVTQCMSSLTRMITTTLCLENSDITPINQHSRLIRKHTGAAMRPHRCWGDTVDDENPWCTFKDTAAPDTRHSTRYAVFTSTKNTVGVPYIPPHLARAWRFPPE
jgi:hypothetical protein